MIEEKQKKRPAMARVNTRITLEQQKYIKNLAKGKNKTEGEIFRAIIDYFIKANQQDY